MEAEHEGAERIGTSFAPILESFSRWHPGGWALPAQTISAGSCFVLLLTWAYLERAPLVRALFRLPFPPFYLAAPAALAAWGITGVCANRPGRLSPLSPRTWALALSIFATAVALWAGLEPFFVERGRPRMHALAVACTMAVLVQAVRLIRIPPSSWLVQHISLLAVLLVLVLGVPAVIFVEGTVVAAEQRLLETRIDELDKLAEHVRDLTTYSWSRAADAPEESRRRIADLERVDVPSWITDGYVWTAANLLGRESDLNTAMAVLSDAVAQAEKTDGPRLTVPQYRYNRATRRWELYPAFTTMAEITVGYYRARSRIRTDIRTRLSSLSRAQPGRQVATQARPQAAAAPVLDWETGWLAPIADAKVTPLPVSSVLLFALTSVGGSTISGAHITDLLELRQQTAELLPPGACRSSSYPEDGYSYFRVDCDAYALTADRTSARLLAELRIVYRSESFSVVRPTDLPHSLYYMFPVPDGTAPLAHQQYVMQQLYDAIQNVYGPVLTILRGGPPTDGFRARIGGRSYQVTRPRPVPGLNAMETQVYRG